MLSMIEIATTLMSSQLLELYLIVITLTSAIIWVVHVAFKLSQSTSSEKGDSLANLREVEKKFWPVQISLVLLFAVVLGILFIPVPEIVSPSAPMFESIEVSNSNPLVIQFSRPIAANIRATMSPNVPGDWQNEKKSTIAFLNDQLVFHPSRTLTPETEYVIEIENISPLAFQEFRSASRYLFVLKTPSLPQVQSIYPVENVKIHQPIEITLSRPSDFNVEWSAEITPRIEFELAFGDDRTKAWIEPLQPFVQGVTYVVRLFRAPIIFDYEENRSLQNFDREFVKEFTLQTVESPSIDAISPIGRSLFPSEPLILKFQEPMDKTSVESALTISPNVELSFSWENDNLVNIIPFQGWEKDTEYTVSINKTAQTHVGGVFEDEVSHGFKTVGSVQVLSVIPENQTQNAPVDTNITINFDQPVVQTDVQNKLTILPPIEGSLSWQDDNTVTISLSSDLNYNQLYTITLEKGIKSIHGSDSKEKITSSFKTVPKTFVLDVPLYKQHHSFTCFSIAAKMALGYRGITGIDEIGFMNEIGYDSTPRNFTTNSWGDPNLGVVGTYNGSGPGGYGAHWGPVSNALSKYRNVEVKRNWNIKSLLETVRQGNPVMVWWVNGVWPAKDVSWFAPSGEKVYTVNGMHVEVIKGWVGDQQNPDYILTNDPWRGNRRYTQSQFLNLWKWFSNTGVIVY